VAEKGQMHVAMLVSRIILRRWQCQDFRNTSSDRPVYEDVNKMFKNNTKIRKLICFDKIEDTLKSDNVVIDRW